MSDAEKIIWAASYAAFMSRNYDVEKAVSHAEDAVVSLRELVRLEKMLSDQTGNYRATPGLSMALEVLGHE